MPAESVSSAFVRTVLDNEPASGTEAASLRDSGFATMVEATPIGLGRRPDAVTRGHLHAIADRSELYVGLSGQGVMILETVNGATEVVEVLPGKAVYVPGYWVHRGYQLSEQR